MINQIKKYYDILKNYSTVYMYVYGISTIIIAIFPFFNIFFIRYILNSLTNFTVSDLNVAVMIYLTVSLLQYIVTKINSFASDMMELTLGNQIAINIMESTENLTLFQFEQHDFQNQIRRAMENSLGVFVSNITIFINTLTTVVTIIISVIYISQWNIFIGITVLIFPFLFYKLYIRINQEHYRVSIKQTEPKKINWYITFLLTQDDAFRENKIFKFSRYLIQKYRKNVGSFIQDTKELFKFDSKISFVPELANILLVILVIYHLLREAIIGTILVGSIVAMLQMTFQILDSSKELSGNIISLEKNSYYIDELIDVLNISKDKRNDKEVRYNQKIKSITLKNISFFRDDIPVFQNFNLHLERGLYFVIGDNGSGKTTLLKLISGLYKPDSGNIVINNRVCERTSDILKQESSVLFQNFKRYENTLKENIFFGDYKEKENKDRLDMILNKELLNFIEWESKNNDIQLGSWFEGARDFSGGEWQKIAFGRTLFKEASIYIFDEPNSMIDEKGCKVIDHELRKLAKENIVIVITHKTHLIKKDDNVIHLKKIVT
ncbi:ABC transporter ATP-binding protein [Dolosigranulum pigrum]|uniref:ABC transporter domain-containing protein n=1 Tax=Dolosigranulum pigrum ATCC 51524 TaxID=883103 RepID=H3NEQ1_9LACT|nr:ABC transporter ATP-binding protein [Dolosigranulum pigrum]EHR32916.1 hypothetical protein HMPREF9703_01032 [Dolosigranulum pigrum ATCC 51524]